MARALLLQICCCALIAPSTARAITDADTGLIATQPSDEMGPWGTDLPGAGDTDPPSAAARAAEGRDAPVLQTFDVVVPPAHATALWGAPGATAAMPHGPLERVADGGEAIDVALRIEGGLGADAPGDTEALPSALRLDLPGFGHVFANQVASAIHENGSRSWVGSVPGSAWPGVLLVSVGDTWYGDIRTEDGRFELRGDASRGYQIVRMPDAANDPFALPEGATTCPEPEFDAKPHAEAEPGWWDWLMGHLPSAGGDPASASLLDWVIAPAQADPPAPGTPSAANTIDVVVGYSAEAAAAKGGENATLAFLQARIDEANLIFVNSGVSTFASNGTEIATGTRYRLVGVRKVLSAPPDPWTLVCPSEPTPPPPAQKPPRWDLDCTATVDDGNGNLVPCNCCPIATSYDISVNGVFEKGTEQYEAGLQSECSGLGIPANPHLAAAKAATGRAGQIPLAVPITTSLATPYDQITTLAELRDYLGADFSGVLLDNEIPAFGVADAEFAASHKPTLTADYAGFQVSTGATADGQFTFAHEMAHLLGTGHWGRVWEDVNPTPHNNDNLCDYTPPRSWNGNRGWSDAQSCTPNVPGGLANKLVRRAAT